MMRFSDGNRSDDPLGRGPLPPPKRTVWQQRARKALDNWAPNSEIAVAVAIEDAYRDGLKRAAAFVEEKGERELAIELRRLADERN